MSLRDTVNRIFSRRTEPRKDWERTKLSREDQKTASGERQRQQRELERRQAETRPQRLNEERARVARERPKLTNEPEGASKVKSKRLIEGEAKKAVQKIEAAEKTALARKTDRHLVADAANRAKAEAEQSRDDRPRVDAPAPAQTILEPAQAAAQNAPEPAPRTGWSSEAEREGAIRQARERREADEREQEMERDNDDPGREPE